MNIELLKAQTEARRAAVMFKATAAGAEIAEGEEAVDADEMIKAFGKKDLSKLTKKTVTDKRGRRTTVWVRTGEKPSGEKGTTEGDGVSIHDIARGKATPEQFLAKHPTLAAYQQSGQHAKDLHPHEKGVQGKTVRDKHYQDIKAAHEEKSAPAGDKEKESRIESLRSSIKRAKEAIEEAKTYPHAFSRKHITESSQANLKKFESELEKLTAAPASGETQSFKDPGEAGIEPWAKQMREVAEGEALKHIKAGKKDIETMPEWFKKKHAPASGDKAKGEAKPAGRSKHFKDAIDAMKAAGNHAGSEHLQASYLSNAAAEHPEVKQTKYAAGFQRYEHKNGSEVMIAETHHNPASDRHTITAPDGTSRKATSEQVEKFMADGWGDGDNKAKGASEKYYLNDHSKEVAEAAKSGSIEAANKLAANIKKHGSLDDHLGNKHNELLDKYTGEKGGAEKAYEAMHDHVMKVTGGDKHRANALALNLQQQVHRPE